MQKETEESETHRATPMVEAVKGYRFHFGNLYRASKLECGVFFKNIRRKVNV